MTSLHMLSSMRRLTESFFTKMAREWAFSGMDPDMSLQRTRLIECLGTKRTFPRLLVGMDSDMPFQGTFLCKFPVTNLALPWSFGIVRLFLGGTLHHEMRTDMQFEGFFRLKPIRTAHTTLEPLFRRICDDGTIPCPSWSGRTVIIGLLECVGHYKLVLC